MTRTLVNFSWPLVKLSLGKVVVKLSLGKVVVQ